MNRSHSIVSSIIYLFSSNILVRLVQFVYITILIKVYGIEFYGLFVLILGYFSILKLVASIGLENIIINKLVTNKKNVKLLNIYMIFYIFIIFIFSLLLYFLKNDIDYTSIIVFSLYSIVSFYVNIIFYSASKHLELSKVIASHNIISYILLLGILNNYELQIYHLISLEFFIKFIFLFIIVYVQYKTFLKNYLFYYSLKIEHFYLFLRFIKKSGKWLVFNLLINKLLNQSLPIILGEFISLKFLGIWDTITKVLSVFQIAISYLEQVIVSKKTKTNILETRNNNITKILYVSLFMSILSIVISSLYIYYLLNDLGFNYFILATILSLTLLAYGYRTFMRALFTINEWTKKIFYINLVSNIIQIGGVFILINVDYATELNVALLYLFISAFIALYYEHFFRKLQKVNFE